MATSAKSTSSSSVPAAPLLSLVSWAGSSTNQIKMMAYFLVRELDILSGNSMVDSVIDGKKSGNVLNKLQAKETKIRYGLIFCRKHLLFLHQNKFVQGAVNNHAMLLLLKKLLTVRQPRSVLAEFWVTTRTSPTWVSLRKLLQLKSSGKQKRLLLRSKKLQGFTLRKLISLLMKLRTRLLLLWCEPGRLWMRRMANRCGSTRNGQYGRPNG